MGDDEGSRLTNSQIPRNHPSFIIRLAIQWKGRSRAKSTSGVGENALFPPTSLREDCRGVLVGQNILHVRSLEKSLRLPIVRSPHSAVRTGEEIRGVGSPGKRSFSARGPKGQREQRSRKQASTLRLETDRVTGSVMRMQRRGTKEEVPAYIQS